MLPAYVARLGNISLRCFSPWLPTQQAQGESYARLGQTGSGAQVTHLRAMETEHRGWDAFTTASDAARFAETVEAMQWSEVTLYDAQWQRSRRVRVVKAKANMRMVLGPAYYLVECEFTLENLGNV